MPRDASVVAVVRDRRVVVPRGDTVLLAGDEVIALVTVDSEDAVRRHPGGVAGGGAARSRCRRARRRLSPRQGLAVQAQGVGVEGDQTGQLDPWSA